MPEIKCKECGKPIPITDSEGKSLVAKYNITQVPTVIISSESC